jgi:hypothetical protein
MHDHLNLNIRSYLRLVLFIEYSFFSASSPGLVSQMMTAEYGLIVAFLSVCNLRLWFYVGNLNSYLEFMSDGDMDVGRYKVADEIGNTTSYCNFKFSYTNLKKKLHSLKARIRRG